MEDYYRLLDIPQQASLDDVHAHLARLNREYRRRSNHRKHEIREEAQIKLETINRAMTQFGSEEERAQYDQELAGVRAEAELQQPLSDIDFYQALQIAPDATTHEVEAALQSLEAQLAGDPAGDETTDRRRSLVALARRTLLDPEKRQAYDTARREKQSLAQARAADKPTPLRVNGIEVGGWSQLETALDREPGLGLSLLTEGEIEAWLRWSLGQRNHANWVRSLADRAQSSATPLMVFEELLRGANASRPLHLYPVGGGPEGRLTVRVPGDLPTLTHDHWETLVGQFEYILDWLSLQPDPDIYSRYAALPTDENLHIQLERLLTAIDPALPPPGLQVEGLDAEKSIDFGVLQAWNSPMRDITVRQTGRGYLYGKVAVRTPWVLTEPEFFQGAETTVQVRIATNQLVGGQAHEGHIELQPLDGRVPPVHVRVRIQQRSFFQSVKHLFSRS